MPCLIALIVLFILSIFSVKSRILAKEAFDCVFRRITLRPCQAGFNQKVKIAVSSWFLKRDEKIGGFVFRRFEILSWIFVILFLASAVYAGRSIYFYAKYGSCTPSGPQNCVINELISPTSTQTATSCDKTLR
jgi:hypothetical protein